MAPRIIKLLPEKVGYKVECTEGEQKIKKANEIVGKVGAGLNPAGAGIELKHGKEKVERKVEFTPLCGNQPYHRITTMAKITPPTWNSPEILIRTTRRIAVSRALH